MDAVYIWKACNAAALERVPGTRPTSSDVSSFAPKFISGRLLDPEDHSGSGLSLKDGLGCNHDITWPPPTLSPRLSTSTYPPRSPPEMSRTQDYRTSPMRRITIMESSSLNDYTPQVLFGSRKASLPLAGREDGSCSICTINAERMPLETKLAAYFVPSPVHPLSGRYDSASRIASSWLF
jgi:hypothetical protein